MQALCARLLCVAAVLAVTRPAVVGAVSFFGRRTPAIVASFPPEFTFGVATAPAHVEDHLDDSWWEWASEGKIPFTQDHLQPHRRLDFWQRPHEEILLARSTGAKLLRLGLDWGRLTPYLPGSFACGPDGYVRAWTERDHEIGQEPLLHRCRSGVQNRRALEHYVHILELVREQQMTVVLTLFHHSLPKWANERDFGGWTNPKLIRFFYDWSRDVVSAVRSLVDQYVILNEPAVFANLVYGVAMWPGRVRDRPDFTWAYLDTPIFRGTVMSVYANLAQAHNRVYDLIHDIDRVHADPESTSAASVGIAHHMAAVAADGVLAKPLARVVREYLNYNFLDRIADKLDFIGVNYYGKELVGVLGSVLKSTEEYSESGRMIYPFGLYQILHEVHQRYNVRRQRSLPILITENGISDETDVLRSSYIIEHLMAVRAAMDDGIPVRGYVFWTVSDNWEWADGYCPKFGLFSVDRSSPELKRKPRPSLETFRKIVSFREISNQTRKSAWKLVRNSKGLERPFCRAADGKSTVITPTFRQFVGNDWHFPEVSRARQMLDLDALDRDDEDLPAETRSILRAWATYMRRLLHRRVDSSASLDSSAPSASFVSAQSRPIMS